MSKKERIERLTETLKRTEERVMFMREERDSFDQQLSNTKLKMIKIRQDNEAERGSSLEIRIDLQKEKRVLEKANRSLNKDLESLKIIIKKMLVGADFKEGESEEKFKRSIPATNKIIDRYDRYDGSFDGILNRNTFMMPTMPITSEKASEIIIQPKVLYVSKSDFIMIHEIAKKEDK